MRQYKALSKDDQADLMKAMLRDYSAAVHNGFREADLVVLQAWVDYWADKYAAEEAAIADREERIGKRLRELFEAAREPMSKGESVGLVEKVHVSNFEKFLMDIIPKYPGEKFTGGESVEVEAKFKAAREAAIAEANALVDATVRASDESGAVLARSLWVTITDQSGNARRVDIADDACDAADVAAIYAALRGCKAGEVAEKISREGVHFQFSPPLLIRRSERTDAKVFEAVDDENGEMLGIGSFGKVYKQTRHLEFAHDESGQVRAVYRRKGKAGGGHYDTLVLKKMFYGNDADVEEEAALTRQIGGKAYTAKDGESLYMMSQYAGSSLKSSQTYDEEVLIEALPCYEDKLNLFTRILREVGDLHDQGFVHRDLKTENICDDGDRIRLIDFGLTRPMGCPSGRQGSTGFWPPEAWATDEIYAKEFPGRARVVTTSEDLYPLGMVFTELFVSYENINRTNAGVTGDDHIEDYLANRREMIALIKENISLPDSKREATAELYFRMTQFSPDDRPSLKTVQAAISMLSMGNAATHFIHDGASFEALDSSEKTRLYLLFKSAETDEAVRQGIDLIGGRSHERFLLGMDEEPSEPADRSVYDRLKRSVLAHKPKLNLHDLLAGDPTLPGSKDVQAVLVTKLFKSECGFLGIDANPTLDGLEPREFLENHFAYRKNARAQALALADTHGFDFSERRFSVAFQDLTREMLLKIEKVAERRTFFDALDSETRTKIFEKMTTTADKLTLLTAFAADVRTSEEARKKADGLGEGIYFVFQEGEVFRFAYKNPVGDTVIKPVPESLPATLDEMRSVFHDLEPYVEDISLGRKKPKPPPRRVLDNLQHESETETSVQTQRRNDGVHEIAPMRSQQGRFFSSPPPLPPPRQSLPSRQTSQALDSLKKVVEPMSARFKRASGLQAINSILENVKERDDPVVQANAIFEMQRVAKLRLARTRITRNHSVQSLYDTLAQGQLLQEGTAPAVDLTVLLGEMHMTADSVQFYRDQLIAWQVQSFRLTQAHPNATGLCEINRQLNQTGLEPALAAPIDVLKAYHDVKSVVEHRLDSKKAHLFRHKEVQRFYDQVDNSDPTPGAVLAP